MPLKYRLLNPHKYASIFVLVLLFLAKGVIAQTSKRPKAENFAPGADIALGLVGQMTFARTPTTSTVISYQTTLTQTVQSQSPSAGTLLTLHDAIRPYLGYNVNFGYTRFTQTDSFASESTTTPGNPQPPPGSNYLKLGSINTNMYELTLSYAIYGPRTKRFRTLGEFGGGGLFFEPVNTSFAKEQTRPAMLFGVGAEYDISRRLSVRAEYRGLFYKMPDFAIGGSFPQHRLFTITNTPAISLVCHFKTPSNPKQFAKTH